MAPKLPIRFGYVLLVLKGLFTAVLPRQALSLVLVPGFRNVRELQARDWYVTTTRATGVGMIATGLTGLLLSRDTDSIADDDDTDDDTDDDPVEIDV